MASEGGLGSARRSSGGRNDWLGSVVGMNSNGGGPVYSGSGVKGDVCSGEVG